MKQRGEPQRESDIQRLIRVALVKDTGVRLFRFQTGQFWQGQIVHEDEELVTLRHARRVHIGFEGLADLDGWRMRTITPEMIGQQIAQWASIEVKRPGENPTDAQQSFLWQVRRMGGLAGIARSADDAKRILLID